MRVQHTTKAWFAAHGVDAAGYHAGCSMQGVMPTLVLLAAGVIVLTLSLVWHDLSGLCVHLC
jgi:hypothetical protein